MYAREKRLERVHIVVDVEVFGGGEGKDLLLEGEEGLAHLVGGCVEFEFEHEFADVEGLDAGNGWAVGTEDAVAEDGAEAVAHFGGKMVKQVVVLVAQVDVDEATERRIVKLLAFSHLVVEHLPVVTLNDLSDDVAVGRAGLEDDVPWGVVAASAPRHLAEGLEGAFVTAEVG